MFLIVSLIVISLIIFGIYKTCVYLNDGNNNKKKKINNVILKICLVILPIVLILLLYTGIDGYLNGSETLFCGAVGFGDCYDYGINGFFLNIIKNIYWSLPTTFIVLSYIIIYKVKYKQNIINNKLLYFTTIIIITLISLIPFYKTIIIYFQNADYKYQLFVEDFDYYSYYIRIDEEKINVIKEEQIICDVAPCNPIYSGEHEIKFTKESIDIIYNYIDTLFENEKDTNTIIISNNNLSENEKNIIKAIIYNDESYLQIKNNSYDYKIITNDRFITLQNDGGTKLNVYYQINLNENKIIKYQDYYVGFKGYEYKDKVIYEKCIDNDTNNQLKFLLESLVTKEDVNDKNNYSPYVIEFNNEEKKIYNSESIKSLENLLSVIDKQ